MSDFHAINMVGPFKGERLTARPTWTSSDIGREIYVTTADTTYGGKFWKASETGWVEVSLANHTHTGTYLQVGDYQPTLVEHIWIGANAMTPFDASGPDSDVKIFGNGATLDVYRFPKATEVKLNFLWRMPSRWNRDVIRFKTHWDSDASGVAGQTVEWKLSGVAFSDGDDMSTSPLSSVVISDALQSVGKQHITGMSPVMTVSGSPALGDVVLFTLSRNISGADNLAVDALLYGVTIEILYNTAAPVNWIA